ncbi:LysM peptidoglycan-binding domain-containing protein [Lactobacillus sp. ESL0791]|uniref:LysM peptidoglycan-binding domain-containing protein n=1 Tax=Lactobacillus sp. ESL0791 TaxID=2983234 RepID=UPI0023F80587|nr:LysM peptidoglycan-binding domain-containing protein [Lactobacillus sp. ESL0791]MDF7638872.1 LysM peptidoglycan-binding domain-containing protein [Lactobacillus sp. ESL0791]
MNQKHEGPYQHYKRPLESRVSKNKSNSSHHWGIKIAFLIIILVALIPVVHHFAAEGKKAGQVAEPQIAKKAKSKNKLATHSKKIAGKKTKAAQVAKSNKKTSKKASKRKAYYVVQSGDTMIGIAAKFHMTVNELAQLNNIDASSQVNAGETLKLK